MLRSILVCVDCGTDSSAVVELATRWAIRHEAMLIGLAVVDEPAAHIREPVPIGAGYYKQELELAAVRHGRDDAEEALRSFSQRCVTRGVMHQTVLDIGSPFSEILNRSHSCDLIMLGQRAQFHCEQRATTDTTLWRLLRQSARPVVVVPESLPNDDVERVLVAYNASPEADRAMQAFANLELAPGAEVHVLSIDDDPAAARRLAEEAATFMKLHHMDAITHTAAMNGAVSDVVVQFSNRLEADIIVMGAFGKSRWREMVFGSTTLEVVEASDVPLFLSH